MPSIETTVRVYSMESGSSSSSSNNKGTNSRRRRNERDEKKKYIQSCAVSALNTIQKAIAIERPHPSLPGRSVGWSVGGWVVAHRGVMEEASGGAREDVIRRFD